MSATAEHDGTRAPEPEAPPGPAPAPTGRSELAVVALLLGLGAFLTHGTVTMTVPATAGTPGPRFFPVIVIGLVFSLAAALAVQVLRRPRAAPVPPVPAAERPRTHTDWRAVGIVVAAFAAFIVLLTPAGWLLSAALLFWGVSYALDGKRPLFDVGVALAVSAAFQLAFSAGLGLNLPAGVLEGAF